MLNTLRDCLRLQRINRKQIFMQARARFASTLIQDSLNGTAGSLWGRIVINVLCDSSVSEFTASQGSVIIYGEVAGDEHIGF